MRVKIIFKNKLDTMDVFGDLQCFNDNDLCLKNLPLVKIINEQGKIEYIPVGAIKKIIEITGDEYE